MPGLPRRKYRARAVSVRRGAKLRYRGPDEWRRLWHGGPWREVRRRLRLPLVLPTLAAPLRGRGLAGDAASACCLSVSLSASRGLLPTPPVPLPRGGLGRGGR